MSAQPSLNRALQAAKGWHSGLPALAAFCPWPDDLSATDLPAHPLPAAKLIASDPGTTSPPGMALQQAITAAIPHLHWQHGYSAAEVGQDFLDRFCWCELIGPAGHFQSQTIRLTLAYWGPNLFYPRHHHRAEEIYSIVSGRALFHADGLPDADLGSEATRQHASNQPHAMTTQAAPVLTLVLWRPPGLTDMFELSQ